MAEDLDDLLNLFFAADGRRNLVRAGQSIQRNTKVFQIRRQFKLLSILFFFLFSFLHLRANVFHHGVRIGAHGSQHVDKKTVVVGERFKNVGCFDCLATLCSGSLHGALEQVGRIWSDAKTFADVLLAGGIQSLLNCHLDHDRIER